MSVPVAPVAPCCSLLLLARCHSLVLTGASSLLHSVLLEQEGEGEDLVLVLEGAGQGQLQLLLLYLYTGTVEVGVESRKGLLDLLAMCQVRISSAHL